MKLITNTFKTHMAKQFVESLSEPQNTIYYMGAHRSFSFSSDSSPPEPGTSISDTSYDLYDELVFGKKITVDDVTHVIRNVPWVANTAYEMYDNTTQDLETKNFFVVAEEAGSYHVFKCLNNNGGAPSTFKPSRSQINPEDEFYVTTDNYQWKFMYSISTTDYLKFATTEYVPVLPDANVASYAVAGAIDTIIIENPGSRYRSFATGNIAEPALNGDTRLFVIESDTMTLSSNNDFYNNCSFYIENGDGDGELRTVLRYYTTGNRKVVVLDRPFDTIPSRNSSFRIAPRIIISGDGQDALARVEINSNTGAVSDVIVVSRGKNYTFADIVVIGNTGSTSATTTTSARLRAIISPKGGHGSDPINELYANKVGISIDFTNSENETIPAINDYRKISLIKDPLFDKTDFILANTTPSEGFTPGESVIQESTGATAVVAGRNVSTLTLTNIRGFFTTSANTSNTALGIKGLSSDYVAYVSSISKSFTTFDQRKIYSAQITPSPITGGGFANDEIVVQAGLNTIESPIIQLTLSTTGAAYGFVDGETITGGTSGATGNITSRLNNVLTINNVSGIFLVGEVLTGGTSGGSATVSNYDDSFAATAVGNIHEVGSYANGQAYIAITNVTGEFLVSDFNTNTINTIKGQTSQASAQLLAIDEGRNRIVDNSGEIMYVENFIPITRSSDQTERVKLIIEF